MWDELDFNHGTCETTDMIVSYDSEKYSARVDMGDIVIDRRQAKPNYSSDTHDNEHGESPVTIIDKSTERVVWEGVMDANLIQSALDMMELGFKPDDAINAAKL